MLKIGVLGAGHLGKIHLHIAAASTRYDLVGFYDPDPKTVASINSSYGYHPFESSEALIEACDVVDIVTPTLSHFEMASLAINAKKHIFIEKPLAKTDAEATALVALAESKGVIGQVGHVERFNPAFQSIINSITAPLFIEAHRLAEFNPRGTDVSVVLDLMIHDIDIILSIVKSGVKKVSASGVSVISETHDIANARIEFDNGCVANLTASRISLKNMRKTRFFQKDAYISVDFLDKKLEVFQLEELEGEADPFDIVLDLGADKAKKKILIDKPDILETNAIKEELMAFHNSIVNNAEIPVNVEDGLNAMLVAHQILDEMSKIYLQ